MRNDKGLSVAEIIGKHPKTMMRSKSKQSRTVAVVSSNKRPVIISVKNGKTSMQWYD
jgi:hypothetical protein